MSAQNAESDGTVLAFVERVEARLEVMSAEAPGYYDDVIQVLRDEAHASDLPPTGGDHA